MGLKLKKRPKSAPARVTMSSKGLVEMLTELQRKAQAGEITLAETRQRVTKMQEDGLFQKWEAPLGQRVESNVVGGHWQDSAEAIDAARAKHFDSATVRKVWSGVVTDKPGETPLLQADEDLRQQKRLQDLNDGFCLCAAVIKDYRPHESKHWREFNLLSKKLVTKILTTQSGGASTGSGGEFIPQTLSGQLIELYRQKLWVAANFQTINMPTSPFKFPVEGVDVNPYLVSEASTEYTGDHTSATDAISTRSLTTGGLTLTAKTFGVRAHVSAESEEDSILSTIGYTRDKLAQSMSEGTEDVIINGDDSSTHQDSDVTAATDHRKAYDGLRILTNSNAKVSQGGTLLTPVKILQVKTVFGKFAQNPADSMVIVSPIGYTQLVSSSSLLTMDKVGNRATILTGQVGELYGMPVVISGKVRENLNAAGVYDASNTGEGMAIVVHRPSFAIGDRRMVTVESAKDIITQKHIVVVTMRNCFVRTQAEVSSPQARNVGYVYYVDMAATLT